MTTEAVPISRIVGWVRSAETKMWRCENEFGYGDVDCIRYSRSRMRGARSLLIKARSALDTPKYQGPLGRKLCDAIANSIEATEACLSEMDAFIETAELETLFADDE